MRRKYFINVLLITTVYIAILVIRSSEVFAYQIDPELIDRYLRSQDIPHDVPGRLFLSDDEIHIAAGYLYAKGADPTDYNFQHPPLVKYFYGFSTIATQNPLLVQIVFGLLLILTTYFLSIKLFGREKLYVSLIPSILLISDPLTMTLAAKALLDLPQALFALLFLISMLFFPKNVYWQGISLGLFIASKFWGAALFFFIFIAAFNLFIKKISLKQIIIIFVIALLFFSLTYLVSFVKLEGRFNIVFFELKTLKYWLNHSVTSVPFASVILFTTGFMKSWWSSEQWIRGIVWNPLWTISFFSASWLFFNRIKKKRLDAFFVISAMAILYVFYLGFQAPFERYFVIVLPFFYICLTFAAHEFSRKKLDFFLKLLK